MSEPQTYLAALGELLVFHGIISSADELSPTNLKELVAKFQEQAGLFVDGNPGRDTLWTLQFDQAMQGNKQNLVDCPADVVSGYEEGFANHQAAR